LEIDALVVLTLNIKPSSVTNSLSRYSVAAPNSTEVLSLRNVDCVEETIEFITFESLAIKTFASNSYKHPNKEIGLKSKTVKGANTLGINVTKYRKHFGKVRCGEINQTK